MEKLSRHQVFPIFTGKRPLILILILYLKKMMEDWQNRTEADRIGWKKQRKTLPVCLNLLSSFLYLRHWVLDNSIGTFIGCLWPLNYQSSLIGLELTVSKVQEENVKVGVRRLNIVAKGERKERKTWERKLQRILILGVRERNTRTKILIHTYWGEITVCGYRNFVTKYRCQNWVGRLWMYKSLWLC